MEEGRKGDKIEEKEWKYSSKRRIGKKNTEGG